MSSQAESAYSYGMTEDGYWRATHEPCGMKSEVPGTSGQIPPSGRWGGFAVKGTNEYMHSWVAAHDAGCPVLREQRDQEREAERARIRALNPHVKGI